MLRPTPLEVCLSSFSGSRHSGQVYTGLELTVSQIGCLGRSCFAATAKLKIIQTAKHSLQAPVYTIT